MRALTVEELDIVAGGDGTIVVTAAAYTAPNFDLIGYSGGGGGSSYGGYQTGSTGPARAGQIHRTQRGYTYTTGVDLSAEQTTNLDKIVDYGMTNGVSQSDIAVAITLIFKESSLSNSDQSGPHRGLGQYDDATWAARGHTGDLNNADHAVAAVFKDIAFYKPLYGDAMSTNAYGLADQQWTFGEYFNAKHNGGRSFTDWDHTNIDSGLTYDQEYRRASNGLNFRPM